MNNKFLAKWYINYLDSKHSGSTIDRISMTLFNSKIKLTPHQIDAALFAFKSPINKGVLLVRRINLTACNLVDEDYKENKVVVEQLDIFTNYETFNKQKEKNIKEEQDEKKI